MNELLNLGWHRTPAEWMELVAWVFVAAKLIATIFQAVLLRHDYRARPDTLLYRSMYVTGKVTPSLAAMSLAVAAALAGDWSSAWKYGLFAIGVAVLAYVVVHLRKQGKFYGIAHLIQKKEIYGKFSVCVA